MAAAADKQSIGDFDDKPCTGGNALRLLAKLRAGFLAHELLKAVRTHLNDEMIVPSQNLILRCRDRRALRASSGANA
ncbi:MAG: hypothetical protein PS018_25435 [bacterium]|nr:hypothetical protein [bacterium]